MLLRPRKYVYKTKQKNRKVRIFNQHNLNYGDHALINLQPLTLTAKQIFRLKLFLKKSTKKSEFTKRRVWFSIFPHLPLTKKPKGMRMGKGSGKLDTWFMVIGGGRSLFEFKNLRHGRAIFFLKQVSYKLPVKTTFLFNNKTQLNLPFLKKLTIRQQTFWF